MPPGVHNRDYLQTKKDKLGHLLDEFGNGNGD
jgi:3,4-dihydroxy 2-butanone 4-phosphate synthase/GTP cyclohydrolase II